MSETADDLAVLDEMIEALDIIEQYTAGQTEESFLSNRQLKDAVALRLVVLGEAARRLSATTRDNAPEVQWSVIRSLRNRIAHGYRGVNHLIVWDLTQERLPGLRTVLVSLLETLEAKP